MQVNAVSVDGAARQAETGVQPAQPEKAPQKDSDADDEDGDTGQCACAAGVDTVWRASAP